MAIRKPGTYAPLSSYYFDDVAVMEAGEDAELLFVRMLAYASRQIEHEGFIATAVLVSRLGILPRYVAGTDAGTDGGIVPGTDALSRAQRLCEVGLLTQVDGGYQINSWLRWNKSAAEANRVRSSDRARKRASSQVKAGSGANVPTGGAESDTDSGAPSSIVSGDTIQNTEYRIQKQKHARSREHVSVTDERVEGWMQLAKDQEGNDEPR